MTVVALNADTGAALSSGPAERFTAEAFAPSGTRSVRFSVNGPITSSKIESTARWTLFGNTGDSLTGGSALPGTYTATAQAFDGRSGRGTLLAAGSVTFTIPG